MANATSRQRASVAQNPIDIHVGKRLRTRRTLLGMSQPNVAEAIGLTFQQLQKYEKGTNRISASRLFYLAKILDVDINYFFDDMDRSTRNVSPIHRGDRGSQNQIEGFSQNDDPLHKRETLELVRAYYRIKDPQVRLGFRKLVQSTAGYLQKS